MTASADLYEEVDSFESFDGLEFADEAIRLPFVPGRKVFAPGGLSSATLHTPKGPAKLNLPSPVPTLTQYRSLEQTVNNLTQRLNATNTQLLQVRKDLVARRPDQGGMGSMGMLLSLMTSRKLREDLEGHTHTANNTPPVLSASGGGGFDSFLPFLLLQPNMFGGSSGTQPGGMGQDMSPLLLLMMFMD